MPNEVQEAVESAKQAQKRAVEKVEEQISSLMEDLPRRMKMLRSIDLAQELESLAGLLRAKHYLRTSIEE